MIHGLVDRPTVFSLDDLRRLPSVSRTVFLECSGNGRAACDAYDRYLSRNPHDAVKVKEVKNIKLGLCR